MGLGRVRPALLSLAGIAAIVAGVAFSPAAGTAKQIQMRSAAYGQTSTVGALFTLTATGQLNAHFCTASVVDSPAGDLVVTAAHCMAGHAASDVVFVPDYVNGQGPYGSWAVTRIIEDQHWVSSSDPDDDFAFLIVRQPGTRIGIQELTGGEVVGIGATGGGTVKVAGYPDGQEALISCQNTALAYSSTQFEFDCDGFTDGTSGSPLLADVGPFKDIDTVIGVIGGYEQGGSTPSVSYAAKFSTRMIALYNTALAAAGG